MWKDVPLESDEVAIIWGQTATQASAGLFRPATYRVVNAFHGLTMHTSALKTVVTVCIDKAALPLLSAQLTAVITFR